MSAYLDASTLVPTLTVELHSDAVQAFLRGYTEPLAVSDFAAAEVACVLSRLVRTGVMEANEAQARSTDFDTWRGVATQIAEIEAVDIRMASIYVRRFDLMLRAPDALHVAISYRLGLTLVTLDRGLADAAHELGIGVIVPGL